GFAHYDRIANSIEQAVRTYQSEHSKADAEEKLRESQERYRMLFEKMLNAFALHEVILGSDGRPIDYIFMEANPAFEKMTGLSADKIIGKPVRDVLPGIEQFWVDIYGKVASTGEPAYFEHYLAALGKYFEVMAFSPQERTFATIFHDITDHKDN
ncbi:MAG TPA: PAS domain S-box protein, partial [Nitrospirota bacterium]